MQAVRMKFAITGLCLLSGAAWAQEAPVVTKHAGYVAEAGRIALHDVKGAISGEMFYTAYRTTGAHRPATFLWNGGPGADSTALHLDAFGPKRIEGAAVGDNAATLLPVSDLVFVDPIGTGFSRSSGVAFDKDFYSTLGDFAAMTQFIQRWLAAHHEENAPVYLVGESFGVWRAAAVAQQLEEQHRPVAGIVLISGGAGVGTGQLPRNLVTALRTPNRAVTALFHDKLPTDLGMDRAAVYASATRWAANSYAPVLENPAALTDAQRNAVIDQLARWTGLNPDQIDSKTLAVTPRQYLAALLPDQKLNTFDMRRTDDPSPDAATIDNYLRHDLGYDPKLAYAGIAGQPADPSAPAPGAINEHWNYNSGVITPEVMAAAMAGEGPPGSQPWALNAIKLDPKLRVLVAAGAYDSLNSPALTGISRYRSRR
jgi:carboxypeptidase C (cathepsin A)